MSAESACSSGKRSYGSKQAARKALSRHHGSFKTMHAYKCELCHGGWHLGHLDPRGKSLRAG